MRFIHIIALPLILSFLSVTACQSKQPPQPQQTDAAQTIQSPQISPPATQNADNTKDVQHDPTNPPVDCPLRKAGLDPTQMKPFEQTEQYIQFLERPDRAEWQKPEEVINALSLTGTERIFDLGSGSGYFAFRMARRLKNGGRVFAGDVDPEMLRHIHHKSMLENRNNIEVNLIDADKPKVPDDIDIVFMCDVLHHVPNPVEWLTHISSQMKSGSRFYMIEFREGDIPQGPPENAKIPKAKLIEIAKQSGLKFSREIENILPYQVFLEFTRE